MFLFGVLRLRFWVPADVAVLGRDAFDLLLLFFQGDMGVLDRHLRLLELLMQKLDFLELLAALVFQRLLFSFSFAELR